MKILGIDPGLKTTGYGFINFERSDIKLLETGTIEPKQRDPIQVKINKVYSILSEMVDDYNPEVLILEKLYAHYKHPITSIILGHVRGVICLICAQKNIKLVEYSVKRIRKAIVGNGNATKQQTKKNVCNILAINEENLPLDASDALALALGYINICGRKI